MIMRRYLMAAAVAIVLPHAAFAAPCSEANSLTKLRNYKSGAYEYVEFWIKAPFSGALSVTAPTSGKFVEDGSGNPISVAGNRWTAVKLTNMAWMCSTQTVISVPRTRIKAIRRISQFEGAIEYVIGRRNGPAPLMTSATIGGQKRIRFRFR